MSLHFLHALKYVTSLCAHHVCVIGNSYNRRFSILQLKYFSSRVWSAGHSFLHPALCTFPVTDTHTHYLQIIMDWMFIHNTGRLQCLKKGRGCLPPNWYGLMSWTCGKKGHLVITGVRKWGFTLIYSVAQKLLDTVFMFLNIECEVHFATRYILLLLITPNNVHRTHLVAGCERVINDRNEKLIN